MHHFKEFQHRESNWTRGAAGTSHLAHIEHDFTDVIAILHPPMCG